MTSSAPNPRVAVTLEQCWHRVPGGTARAALATAEAVRITGGVEQIGLAAWHRSTPAEPWKPTIPFAMLDLPRNVLYETWHRLRWPTVERATGPVAAIHVTGVAMPPRSVPIVVTLHDLAFLRYPGYFTRHGLRFFHAALDRMRHDADVVLCSSRATADDAVAAGLPIDRVEVVPLGVTPVAVSADRVDAVRRRFGLGGRYVLHLGTNEPRKNAAALVRMAPSLPEDVSVVFAGGSGWGDPLTVPRTTGRRLIELGFVSEADKWALLAGASVFCYPSYWEGFGLPVAEAMAMGTPVVTSSGTSLAEVVGDAGICADPTDDVALAGAVRRILDDPPLASELAERGHARAATLSWSATAAATIDAFHRVQR